MELYKQIKEVRDRVFELQNEIDKIYQTLTQELNLEVDSSQIELRLFDLIYNTPDTEEFEVSLKYWLEEYNLK